MRWPFKRNPERTEAFAEPHSIPIYDTNHESTIEAFLQHAADKASTLPSGAIFTAMLPPKARATVTDSMELVGPILIRGREYGLRMTTCINWEFHFTKM